MDPNEVLNNLRQAYSAWEDTIEAQHGPTIDVGSAMRDSIVILDEWLCRGGFLPLAWQQS